MWTKLLVRVDVPFSKNVDELLPQLLIVFRRRHTLGFM